MSNTSQTTSPANARTLLPYTLGLVIAMAIVHVIAFVTVTMSFNLHAVIQTVALRFGDVPPMPEHSIIFGSWFGATIAMSALWGLGLLIHLLGAVLGRGWED
ncbi:MAG: hypothetical protein ACTIA2_14785 [Brevibacterium aurantiacum]|uniref:Uncharacterized protein n=1 Tax=Brevibacterium aurantiacum TaxID=273384 RepID=A0A2H1KH50_BREAU|nr:hypothetical protein [Brevibacterium aurantiacum]SMX99056.1 hypothetical protein BAURA63_03327 [Brevibacterium aurantiacum]